MELINRLYALLLRLYPISFRREFGEEMQEVFSKALEEAAGKGRSNLAGVFLRELEHLPASLLALFQAWVHSPMPEGASLERESPACGSWSCALIAGAPHFLFALSLYLPLLITTGLALPNYRGPSVPIFWGLVLVVLFFARRLGWPRWSASWIGYSLVLLLSQISLYFPHGPLANLAGIVWLVVSATVLFWLARRDWMAGLLAILPVTPMWVWLARLDGFPTVLEPAAVFFGLSLVITLVVIAIVLLGSWQTTLLLLLLIVLATGSPDLYRTGWSAQEGLGGSGSWIVSYLGLLVFTAPLWLMALWRQAQRR